MPSEEQRQEVRDKLTRLVMEQFGGNFEKTFEHYDNNRRAGKLYRAELGRMLRDAGIGNWLTRGLWVNGLLAELDTDKDGAISRAEFAAAIKK